MDDLISRQAAIDAITDERIVTNMDSVYDSDLHRCKRATHRILASLPSAERHGRWLHLHLDPDNITGHTKGECSICGKLRIVDNYCPNCGAKMEGK